MIRIHSHLSRAPRCGLALSLLATFRPDAIPCQLGVGYHCRQPLNGSHVTSPVLVQAHNIGCDGVPPASFGYSIDSTTGLVLGTTPNDIDVTAQSIPSGTHTIHFKSWTQPGRMPDGQHYIHRDRRFHSGPDPDRHSSGADSSGDMDGSSKWTQAHDGGTPGTSRGSTVYPATTPLYDDARKFYMTYTDKAGERWSDTFTKDPTVYFVLDTYIFLPNPSEVMNIELDINQVTSNDETVILSTQCSGEIGNGNTGTQKGLTITGSPQGSSATRRSGTPMCGITSRSVCTANPMGSSVMITSSWTALKRIWGEDTESAHFLRWGEGDLNIQFQIEGAS